MNAAWQPGCAGKLFGQCGELLGGRLGEIFNAMAALDSLKHGANNGMDGKYA